MYTFTELRGPINLYPFFSQALNLRLEVLVVLLELTFNRESK